MSLGQPQGKSRSSELCGPFIEPLDEFECGTNVFAFYGQHPTKGQERERQNEEREKERERQRAKKTGRE